MANTTRNIVFGALLAALMSACPASRSPATGSQSHFFPSCSAGQSCTADASVPKAEHGSDAGKDTGHESKDASIGGSGGTGKHDAGGAGGSGGAGSQHDGGMARLDAGGTGGSPSLDAGPGTDAASSKLDCTIRPSLFPGFDRSCSQASDCAVVAHQRDCCGTRVMLGIRADQAQAFAAAEMQCEAQYPACGCAEQAPSADDGTMFDSQTGLPASVDCVDQACQSTFKSPSKTPCGPNMTCDTATQICVAREPVGPAIVYECKTVPPGCEQDRSCRCTAQTCNAGFDMCQDQGWNNIDCICATCQ